MYKKCNCEIKVKGNSLEEAIRKFNSEVKDSGILRDYKINVIMSREERRAFKKFIRDRRRKKKQQRILRALERLDNYKIVIKNRRNDNE